MTVCAKCGEELGSRYYSDVPGVGDLCLPCHEEWSKRGSKQPTGFYALWLFMREQRGIKNEF